MNRVEIKYAADPTVLELLSKHPKATLNFEPDCDHHPKSLVIFADGSRTREIRTGEIAQKVLPFELADTNPILCEDIIWNPSNEDSIRLLLLEPLLKASLLSRTAPLSISSAGETFCAEAAVDCLPVPSILECWEESYSRRPTIQVCRKPESVFNLPKGICALSIISSSGKTTVQLEGWEGGRIGALGMAQLFNICNGWDEFLGIEQFS